MTVPLLVGLDGTKKMSQSLGNYISVKDQPAEMFGKTMSIPDTVMEQWFVLAAGYREKDAAALLAEVIAGKRHPGETKRLLAREIVTMYWGSEAAAAAEAKFDVVFKDKGVPDDVPTTALGSLEDIYLPALLERAGLVSSRSEARRLIKQGAVKLEGDRIDEETLPPGQLVGKVIQVGKRRFVRVEA